MKKSFSFYIAAALFITVFILHESSNAKINSEIYNTDFYRAPGGKVIFQPPKLNSKKWTVAQSLIGGMRHFTIYLGNIKTYNGRISIIMPRAIKRRVTAKNMSYSYAKNILKKSKFLKSTNQQKEMKIPSGEAFFIGLKGKNPQKVDVVVGIIGIADPTYALTIIIESSVKTFGKMYKVTNSILKTMKIGKDIPLLPRNNPGIRLQGVYSGPLDSDYKDTFMVFDQKGYLSYRRPYSELDIDLEALYQYKNTLVYTYRVSGNNIFITNYKGKSKSYKFKKTRWKIYINDNKWEKLDGSISNGRKLSGHFKTLSYSSTRYSYSGHNFSFSSDYYFKKDGRFSFSSNFFAHSDHYANDGVTTTGTTDAHSGKKPTNGKYKIKNNKLYLYFSNGEVSVKTFYPSMLNGKVLGGKIFINGTAYLMN